jgi:regulator of replication initiation timing
MKYEKGTSARKTRAKFIERITELRERVRALRTERENLETERDQLREENQSLRRDLTHFRLMDDLMGLRETETEDEKTGGQQARSLYQSLSPTCSFSEFFRVAEEEDVGTDAARRCLRHFLNRELLVQQGGQLAKRQPASAAESSEDHPRS